MPPVALALIAFAAGLLTGFGGAVLMGTALVGCLLLARWSTGAPHYTAYAALSAAAFAAATLRAEHDETCLARAERAASWRLTMTTDAAPGATGRATLASCDAHAVVVVKDGELEAGAITTLTGTAIRTNRGLLIRDAERAGDAGPAARSAASALHALRARAGRGIDHAFGEDAGMVRALLIADTRGLDPAMRDRFATAGVVHMLSISGLHVAIIAGAVILLLRAARLGRRAALAWSVPVTAFYVLLIGAPPPAVRSATMLAASAACALAGRSTSPWAPLALGAAVPLAADLRAVQDLGWQLSVIGIAGLIGSGALARRWIQPRWSGARAAAATVLLASTVTTLTSAPLLGWYFGRLSVIGPLANVVATPIVAVLQPALFLAMVLEPFPEAARFVADAAHPLLVAFDLTATWAAAVPGASVGVSPSLTTACLAAIGAAALIAACVTDFPGRPLGVAAAAAVVAVWLPVLPTREPGALEMHVLDVGQGDAVALRTPRGRWILFDAGKGWRSGDDGRRVVIPYLRTRGGEVAALFISHPHADHLGGVATIARALAPRAVYDGAYLGGSELYRRSLATLQEEGIPWRRTGPGDSLEVDGVHVIVLAPDSLWMSTTRDANEASVVALVRYGAVRLLLTGDAERGEEAWLVTNAGARLRADILKVGHHGSRTSSTPAFIDAVRPRLALVSVGNGNTYGHPHVETLRGIAARGATVLRTDREGTIVVRTDGRRIDVLTGGDWWRVSPR
ncbi:MAG TPA: DNA internalization-related competence protein ComEC/Rec2 [Gemmatimonadaceae bacterium]|nr:DNA internalization-related competence protein ComEC/Rec2 [Gemmatimonadaceae bacterium]